MTVLSSLLDKYCINPNSIGRLEVGTESMLHRSKCVKQTLMQLLANLGHLDVEYLDFYNTSFGGTSAFFDVLHWFHSPDWDGSDAVLVTGDIAMYGAGEGRLSGGSGCVAMLIGPNAPIIFEPGLSSFQCAMAEDFYRCYHADVISDAPRPTGDFQTTAYMRAIDTCYGAFNEREKEQLPPNSPDGLCTSNVRAMCMPVDRFDYMCLQAPSVKAAYTAYIRMVYGDFLTDRSSPVWRLIPDYVKATPYEHSLTSDGVRSHFKEFTPKRFERCVSPSHLVQSACGNLRSASIYASILSIITSMAAGEAPPSPPPSPSSPKRIGIFSHDDRLGSFMYSLQVIGDISTIAHKVDLPGRLAQRIVASPEEYENSCLVRESGYHHTDYVPCGDLDSIQPGTIYIAYVCNRLHKDYGKKIL